MNGYRAVAGWIMEVGTGTGAMRTGDHDGPDRSNRFHVGWWRGVKPTHRHFAHIVAICERSCRWSR